MIGFCLTEAKKKTPLAFLLASGFSSETAFTVRMQKRAKLDGAAFDWTSQS